MNFLESFPSFSFLNVYFTLSFRLNNDYFTKLSINHFN